MEYRDQGYAGKSVPAEWLVLGPQGCEKLARSKAFDRFRGEDRGKKRRDILAIFCKACAVAGRRAWPR